MNEPAGLTSEAARRLYDERGPNSVPEERRHDAVVLLAEFMGPVPWLAFGFVADDVGHDALHFDQARLQTLGFVMPVLTGQATVYLVRERRRLYRSTPSRWLLASTGLDLAAMGVLASRGVLMAPVPLADLAELAGSVALAALLVDGVKVAMFRRVGVGPPSRPATWPVLVPR